MSGGDGGPISVRTKRKEELQKISEEAGIPISAPLQGFLNFFLDNQEIQRATVEPGSTRENVYEYLERQTEKGTPENFGLKDEFYGSLIELSGEYFHELFDEEGDFEEAMDIGQEIYDFDEVLGDYLARVTVRMMEKEYILE